MSIDWDGLTQPETIHGASLQLRVELADASKAGRWNRVLSLLEGDAALVNASRPGGTSLFAPLHQAAYGGASEMVVQRLLDAGAWRTLQNSRGERAVDVAQRRGHTHLFQLLEPVIKHRVPIGILLKVQANFHEVIRGRAGDLVQQHQLRLPELAPLLELDAAAMWFPVPGMYGGFRYRLEAFGVQPKLVAESWCRVEGGSGQRHEITSVGSQLVAQGFV